jgi:hypothetical protein
MKTPKKKKMQDFEVTFTETGDLCSRAYSWKGNKKEANAIFADTLEYDTYHSSSGGNSHIIFKSVNSGRKFSMFMSDFDEILTAKRFIDNQVVGLFCFCKKGSSQGIRLIFEDNP